MLVLLHISSVVRFISVFSVCFLSACGGGGSGKDEPSTQQSPIVTLPSTPTSAKPVIEGESLYSVLAGENVQLAQNVSDADGDLSSVTWTQMGGVTVVGQTVTDGAQVSYVFTAPVVTQETELVFQIIASDDANGVTTKQIRTVIRPQLKGVVFNTAQENLPANNEVSLIDMASGETILKTTLSESGEYTFDLPRLPENFYVEVDNGSVEETVEPAAEQITVGETDGQVELVAEQTELNEKLRALCFADEILKCHVSPISSIVYKLINIQSGISYETQRDAAVSTLEEKLNISLQTDPFIDTNNREGVNFTAINNYIGSDSTHITEFIEQVTAVVEGDEEQESIELFFNDVSGNRKPRIQFSNIGFDVVEGALIELSAVTSDSDGAISLHRWSQISGPAVLFTGNSSSIAFIAPEVESPTTLSFRLMVTDDDDAFSEKEMSLIVVPRLTISENQPPLVNAGESQWVNEGELVNLSGSAVDNDGSLESFIWRQVEGPELTIDNPEHLSTFISAPPVLNTTSFIFELTVADDQRATGTDRVLIVVNPVNVAPTSDAGEDIRVVEQTEVNLSGVNSFDSDGSIASYQWRQTSGVPVELINASSSNARFISPVTTTEASLTFTLTVKDNEGAFHTDSVLLTVDPVNTAPVAEAGEDLSVNEQVTITLNGSASVDTDGSIARYQWVQLDGIAVELLDDTEANARFISPATLATTWLTFELIVTDNEEVTSRDLVQVAVNPVNAPPQADVGNDLSVNEDRWVTLDGSASRDTDGLVSEYRWFQIEGTPVDLQGVHSAHVSFTTPKTTEITTLTFGLEVTDNERATHTDSVTVTVNPVNTDPVAHVGNDLIVDEQSTVTLNGELSHDSDGSIDRYLWTQTSGVPVELEHVTEANVRFMAPETTEALSLSFSLTVTDNEGEPHTDSLTVTVNPVNVRPVADTGNDFFVNEQEPVTLNGAMSRDHDGSITKYRWVQTDGIEVELTDPTSMDAGFISPETTQATTLTFELTVTDNEGGEHSDSINVTVNPVNAQPIAEAGNNFSIDESTVGHLKGELSHDSDGTITSYQWVNRSDVFVLLIDADKANAQFAIANTTEVLTLTFDLIVKDNEGASHKDSVTVTVNPINATPVANVGGDLKVDELTSVSLNGRASTDSDGSIVKYQWAQTAGTPVTLLDADKSIARFTAPETTEVLTLTFRLTVTDNEDGFHHDSLTVTVNPVNYQPVANTAKRLTVNEQETAILKGESSRDRDGSITEYRWEQTGGLPVELMNATQPNASFLTPTLEKSITLTFSLTVIDNEGASDSDSLTVSVRPVNAKPVADAGSDFEVDEQTLVKLNGDQSYDDDGSIDSYRWANTIDDSLVELVNATTAEASFLSPTVTKSTLFLFELVVTDNEGATHRDTVWVTVNPVNLDPVAEAGEDIVANEQSPVDLSGEASSDSDGSIDRFIWRQVEGAKVSLVDINEPTLSFVTPKVSSQETLRFSLTVIDNEGGKHTDFVAVTVDPVFEVTLAFPSEQANFYGSQMDVTGRVDNYSGDIDSMLISVESGGTVVPASIDNAGFWRAEDVPVVSQDGQAVVHITATDEALNQTTTTSTLDTRAPISGTEGLVLDELNGKLYTYSNPLDAIVSIDMQTGDRVVLSGESVGSGIEPSFAYDMVLYRDVNDPANDQIISASNRSVWSTNIATGHRTVIADDKVGSGAPIESTVRVIAIDSKNQVAYISNSGRIGENFELIAEIIQIDLVSSQRKVISGEGIGAGPQLKYIDRMVFNRDKRVLYAMSGILSTEGNRLSKIVEIDIASGNRTIISSDVIGTGSDDLFKNRTAGFVYNHEKSHLLVTTVNFGEVYQVDVNSGDRRTYAADFYFPDFFYVPFTALREIQLSQDGAALYIRSDHEFIARLDRGRQYADIISHSGSGSRIGANGLLFYPRNIQYDAAKARLLFSSSIGRTGNITELDIAKASRSILLNRFSPTGFKFDSLLNNIVFNSTQRFAVRKMNLDSSVRRSTRVTDSSVGEGPTVDAIGDLTLNIEDGLVYILERNGGTILEADLETGHRRIVSSLEVGDGPVLKSIEDMYYDPVTQKIYVGGFHGIYSIDPKNGSRRLLLDTPRSAEKRLDTQGLMVGNNGQSLYFTSWTGIDGGLYKLNLSDNTLQTLAENTQGQGVPFFLTGELVLDEEQQRAFFINSGSIVSIDLISGDRVVIAK